MPEAKRALSRAEILELWKRQATVRAVVAGWAIGLAESGTRAAIERGDFPLEVIRIGPKQLCRTADLVAYLGLRDDAAEPEVVAN
jgi:hypothetical protein